MPLASDLVIGTILKHDKKITSYKIALIRSINDVVLSFPDMAGEEGSEQRSIAIPLRMLAQFWVAYYWPFTDPNAPILQGQPSYRNGQLRSDISFRPALEALRVQWEKVVQSPSLPSDGHFLYSEFRTPRRRISYPPELQAAHNNAVRACMEAIKQPIQYAGVGEYSVFDRPRRLRELGPNVTAVPGTLTNDVCLVLSAALWNSFRSLSLWIEALAVHEWCLFSERFTTNSTNGSAALHRGDIYYLLTARPDNRRPLNWERNRIELLMMEGVTFTCPWTFKTLSGGEAFDIDHLLPLAVYPVNELWNLLPADRSFNQNEKRDRIPNFAKLQKAQPFIALGYDNYERQSELRKAVREDASLRFANLGNNENGSDGFANALAARTVRFIEQVAQSRSVARC